MPPGPDVSGTPSIPDYQLIRRIGRGAYGDVWLARTLTGAFRAVKIVWRDRFADAGPFDREFRGLTEFAAVSLAEVRQVALLHVGRSEAGAFFYYVMELADDAETGREIRPESYVPLTVAELRRRRGRLPAAECLALGTDLAEAVALLHSRNLVHRDIKPSNVIMVGGRPKLVDIGLVATADDARTYVGTEGYIAPEGPGTPAADVYSLGMVLYEVGTGRDRRDFPRLPADWDSLPDQKAFLGLNTVIIRAGDPAVSRRYPDAGEMLRDLRRLSPAGREGTPGMTRRLGAAAAAGLLVLAAGAWLWWGPRQRPQVHFAGINAAVEERSIAVLPFQNLSPDPANAFFADGVHEDLIVKLAKIHDLKVISRTSVMAYGSGNRDLRAIARDLGVAYIMEGSVRRSADKIRVAVLLVDARSNQSIWSEIYDRDMTDVFAIQSDLAERIAGALRARILPEERRLISRRPTADQEAYELYLQAQARATTLGNSGSLDQYQPVVALYEQAIARDPRFSLAYAQLSMVHSMLYWYRRLDSTPARLAMAKSAADAARRLAPDDPETKLALGHLAYNGALDLKAALGYFTAAEAEMPNDDQVLFSLALVYRRLGRWDEALDYLGRAAALNPRAVDECLAIAETLPALRRYEQAATEAGRYLDRFPDNRALAEILIRVRLEIDGDRDAYLEAFDALPVDPNDPYRVVDRYLSAYKRSDWIGADRILGESDLSEVRDENGDNDVILDPVVLVRARLAFLRGDTTTARAFAEQALAYFRSRQWVGRQQPWVLAKMGEADAYDGRGEAALKEGTQAWTLVLSEGDAVDRIRLPPLLGRIDLILGRGPSALERLRQMMTGPCTLGPQQVRLDPFWSRLAPDPRFEKILRAARPI